MKFIKKAVAALLGLTMSFSLFACGGESDTSSDATNSGPLSGLLGQGNLEEGEGAKYLEGIVDAVKEANTITLDFDFSYSMESSGKANGVSPANGDTVTVSTSTMTVDVTLNCVFAKTENGYNASIKGNLTGTEDEYKYEEPVEMRIVDGVVYNYDSDDEIWESESFTDLIGEEGSQVYTVLETIYTALNSEEIDLSKVYAYLGPVLEQYCYISNNKYNFELDLKDEMNETLQYLANLDYNQTAEAFLNDVLKQLGAETTVKAIIDELASYGTYTVGDAYEALNEWLQQEYQTDANGLKNELVKEVETLLAEFKDYIPPLEYVQISTYIEQIKNANLDELITPYKDFSVDNLVTLATGNQFTSMENMLNYLHELLSSMTANDLLKGMGMNDFVEIVQEFKDLSFTDYKQTFAMKFNGFKISSASETVKVGFTYDGTYGKAKLDVSESFELKLSSATTTIEAPIAA